MYTYLCKPEDEEEATAPTSSQSLRLDSVLLLVVVLEHTARLLLAFKKQPL